MAVGRRIDEALVEADEAEHVLVLGLRAEQRELDGATVGGHGVRAVWRRERRIDRQVRRRLEPRGHVLQREIRGELDGFGA
jgi:hypothetical protein